MRAVGGLLLVLGMVGLLMNLILWLPTGFNLVAAVLISIVCFVAIWGGGKLSQTQMESFPEPARQHETETTQTPQSQWVQQSATCPRCGSQVAPGQQFCGGCGSTLESYCARCGVAITAPSRFCGNCGARLS